MALKSAAARAADSTLAVRSDRADEWGSRRSPARRGARRRRRAGRARPRPVSRRSRRRLSSAMSSSAARSLTITRPSVRNRASKTSRRWAGSTASLLFGRVVYAFMRSMPAMTKPRPGVEIPDHRGRLGLDQAGRTLRRNRRVRMRRCRARRRRLARPARHHLSSYQHARWPLDARTSRDLRPWERQRRILLYDPHRRTVLLSRQFRYPVYVNDHRDGLLIETAAGLLDDDDPDDRHSPRSRRRARRPRRATRTRLRCRS